MTVALVLAGEADAGLCGQLAALGVRRIDAADGFAGGEGLEGAWPGLLTVAAALVGMRRTARPAAARNRRTGVSILAVRG